MMNSEQRYVRTRAYAVENLLEMIPTGDDNLASLMSAAIWDITMSWQSTADPVLAQIQLDRMAAELREFGSSGRKKWLRND